MCEVNICSTPTLKEDTVERYIVGTVQFFYFASFLIIQQILIFLNLHQILLTFATLTYQ